MDTGERWGHAPERTPERWIGAFTSRDECIADGRKTYGRDFYITRGTTHDPADFVTDSDFIVDDMANNASDNCGDVAEDFPNVSDEATSELDAFLKAWANKHAKCDFWTADGEPEKIAFER